MLNEFHVILPIFILFRKLNADGKIMLSYFLVRLF